MAKYKQNKITRGLSGAFDKQFVFKTYGDITIISKYPDMSTVKPTKKQMEAKRKFHEAVSYAKAILADPRRKEAYQKLIPPGKSIYHFAIAEYMQNIKKV